MTLLRMGIAPAKTVAQPRLRLMHNLSGQQRQAAPPSEASPVSQSGMSGKPVY
jgi:hypothetical protein